MTGHPKRPKKHWDYENSRKEAVAVCKDIQVMRNRLSHCKPLWPEGWFRGNANQHWSDMLSRLTSRRAGFVEALSWVCPATAQLHKSSFAGRWFDQLSQHDAVVAYVQQPLAAGADLRIPQADPEIMKAYLARA